MIIKKSKIQFDDLVILQSNFKFISPKDLKPDDFSVIDLMEKYLIDIDFGFKEEDHGTFIYSKISINEDDNNLEGYQIFVEGCGFIDIKRIKSIDQSTINDILYLPGLNILINQLRAYILTQTSYAPFGKYLLPAIDLTDLYRLKLEQKPKKDKVRRVDSEGPSKKNK